MLYAHALNLIKRAIKVPTLGPVEHQARDAFRARLYEAAEANKKGWPWYLREGFGRNGGGYDTGTVALTQNSRTVTLTGGTWPTACQDWRLSPAESETEIYRIASRTSDTVVVLDRPYEGETKAAAQYRAWDPYVRLPSDLYRWTAIVNESNGSKVAFEDLAFAKENWPKPSEFGAGRVISHAPPTSAAAYSTGSLTLVAGTASATLATGTWPEWCVSHHVRVEKEEELYKVTGRSSDSVVTLDRAYGGPHAGSSKSYELDPPGAFQVEVTYPPEDQYALKVYYWALPRAPVNDTDEIEGPPHYVDAVIALAIADVTLQQIDHTRMSPEMIQSVYAAAGHFEKRGSRALASMLAGNEPAPDDDGFLRSTRYGRSSAEWSPFAR